MKNKLVVLVGFIDQEWKNITNILEKLTGEMDVNQTMDEKETIYIAYYLHNLYSSMEQIFEQVAKTFENDIDVFSRYHAELLKKMTLNVYKTRPPLITNEAFRILDELRKFRHVFRHAYNYDLDPKRISHLVEMVIKNWHLVDHDKTIFRNFLIESIEEK